MKFKNHVNKNAPWSLEINWKQALIEYGDKYLSTNVFLKDFIKSNVFNLCKTVSIHPPRISATETDLLENKKNIRMKS